MDSNIWIPLIPFQSGISEIFSIIKKQTKTIKYEAIKRYFVCVVKIPIEMNIARKYRDLKAELSDSNRFEY